MRIEIEQRLRRYLPSLVGGRDGCGWQFSDRSTALTWSHRRRHPGVEAIDSISIYDEDRRVMVESVKLSGDERCRTWSTLAVIERVRQEMI